MRQETHPGSAGVSFETLLAYRDAETAQWRGWFERHPPDVLEVRLSDGEAGSVRHLVRHVFAVELRYAQRLAGERVTDWSEFREETLDEIFAIGDRARALAGRFLAGATDADFQERLTFATLSAGTITASKHKILANFVNHGVRHWAQIATALRQAGHGDQWPHDLLASAVLD
ncbi:MAG TPA: DinB family protein [Gemmatimonadales bacterium]|nr:DinB family protein [Gemmatimonadales bacterium]